MKRLENKIKLKGIINETKKILNSN